MVREHFLKFNSAVKKLKAAAMTTGKEPHDYRVFTEYGHLLKLLRSFLILSTSVYCLSSTVRSLLLWSSDACVTVM